MMRALEVSDYAVTRLFDVPPSPRHPQLWHPAVGEVSFAVAKRVKHYPKTRDQRTGRRRRTHRVRAEEVLGRALLPGEVVHHRDGNRENNEPENILILVSQAQHASLEYHLRQRLSGCEPLFPEVLLAGVNDRHVGTLFEHVLVPTDPPQRPRRKWK